MTTINETNISAEDNIIRNYAKFLHTHIQASPPTLSYHGYNALRDRLKSQLEPPVGEAPISFDPPVPSPELVHELSVLIANARLATPDARRDLKRRIGLIFQTEYWGDNVMGGGYRRRRKTSRRRRGRKGTHRRGRRTTRTSGHHRR